MGPCLLARGMLRRLCAEATHNMQVFMPPQAHYARCPCTCSAHRAPTLYRRFGGAGEVAVDLLSRLLQFDPARRASAEESMAHEYFALLHMEAQMAGERR